MYEYKRKILLRRLSALAAVILIIVFSLACCGSKEKVETVENLQERTAFHYSGVEEYEVQPFDTLWGIALSYCPESVDVRKWIDDVERLNGRTSSDIYSGETIKVYVF